MSEEPEHEQQEQAVKKPARQKKNFTQISAIKRESKSLTIFTASVPFPFAAQAFNFDSGGTTPEERAQRTLDPRHAKKIRQYLENNDNYYLPPLIVSVSGEVEFIPSKKDSDIGTLVIGMAAIYKILDGQHRTAAIRQLIDKKATREAFIQENISVDFLLDIELAQAKTYFRLLNATGKPVSKNLTLLYADDSLSQEMHDILASVPLFSDDLVEKEKTNLNAKNEKLFVYKWLFSATQRMKPCVSPEFDAEYCRRFWSTLAEIIPQWKQTYEGGIIAQQVREGYICGAGIFIEALGEVGLGLVGNCRDNPKRVEKHLSHLRDVDWSKTNPAWQNQVVDANGKMLSRSGTRKFLTEFMLDRMNLAHKHLAA